MVNSKEYHYTFNILCGVVRMNLRRVSIFRLYDPELIGLDKEIAGRLIEVTKQELTRLRIIRELSFNK